MTTVPLIDPEYIVTATMRDGTTEMARVANYEMVVEEVKFWKRYGMVPVDVSISAVTRVTVRDPF